MLLYEGAKLRIELCDGAEESLTEALNMVEPHCREKERGKIFALLCQLGDTKSLRSPDSFRNEGADFYAVRSAKLRAYGWFEPGAFVVSHMIRKKKDKLSSGDVQRMRSNRLKFKGNL